MMSLLGWCRCSMSCRFTKSDYNLKGKLPYKDKNMDQEALKRLILEVIDEEFHPNPAPLAARWQGGTLKVIPGNDSQPKDIPIDVFFRKINTVRDALRVLEQKINTNNDLAANDKVTFQGYISKAYGALTTFNVLFKDGKDRFVGSRKDDSDDGKKEQLTYGEAKRRLGLNEYD